MTELDDGLLRCELRLAKEQNAGHDPVGGRSVLTALELSSLNLLGCHAVVSAPAKRVQGFQSMEQAR